MIRAWLASLFPIDLFNHEDMTVSHPSKLIIGLAKLFYCQVDHAMANACSAAGGRIQNE